MRFKVHTDRCNCYSKEQVPKVFWGLVKILIISNGDYFEGDNIVVDEFYSKIDNSCY